MTRTLTGDLDAYEGLVARYTAIAHRTAVLMGAGDDADDIVQEAFVKAYVKLATFRLDRGFRPWLLRIVVNETKNLHRSRSRREAWTLRATDEAPRVSVLRNDRSSRTPETAVLDDERRSALLIRVRALPDKHRDVILCRFFLDLDEAETATTLGCRRGTVKSRTSRALAGLRAALGDRDRWEVSDE